MKTAILGLAILTATTAAAETTIIENSDQYYVESTGVSGVNPASAPGNRIILAETTSGIDDGNGVPPATAMPVTDFDNTPQPVDPADRRASIENTIQRLQRERSDLMTPQEGETPDQIASREQEAAGKLRKINKLTSELQNIPVQSINLSK